jgi:hypothetical protein
VTAAPTKTPTANPTFAPTPEATNPPKPVFAAEEFDLSLFTPVAEISTTVTLSPTTAPTAVPTSSGYKAVEVEKEVEVVEAALTFALSLIEAENPVMRQSLKNGFAFSLGLPPATVEVTHINGNAITAASRRTLSSSAHQPSTSLPAAKMPWLRQLADGVDITFSILSASSKPSQLDELKANVAEAAAEGSIVANVQKVAADKGVLTLSLLNMERAITEVAIVQKTQIIVVVEHVRETLSPTASPTPPTPAPTLEPTAASSGGTKWVRMVVGIVVAAVLLLTGFTCVRLRQRAARKSTSQTAPMEEAEAYAIDGGSEGAGRPYLIDANPMMGKSGLQQELVGLR